MEDSRKSVKVSGGDRPKKRSESKGGGGRWEA